MPGFEKMHFCLRQVFAKCFCPRRNEETIVLSPDRKERRLLPAEIFVELWIELEIRLVVQKQIQLNLFVAWALEKSRVQRVGLGRDIFRICYAVRVLPARSACGQNRLPQDVPIVGRRSAPILSNRTPS